MILRTHVSKPKLGATLVEARVRDRVSSHSSGRRTKVMGAIRCAGNPPYSGVRMPPMRPMSWYGGSQETIAESASCSSRRWIARRLCSRLSSPTMTPLGDEVEPEVYWRNAGPCRTGPGSRQSSAPAVSAPPPVTSQRNPPRPNAARSPGRPATKREISSVVSACVARASRAIAASRGMVRPNRRVSGG